MDAAVFASSRWEGVTINQFSAYEELWFEDRAVLEAFLTGQDVHQAVHELQVKYLTSRIFTFLCREIVQIDHGE